MIFGWQKIKWAACVHLNVYQCLASSLPLTLWLSFLNSIYLNREINRTRHLISRVVQTSSLASFPYHDDVIKWQHFSRSWTFLGESIRYRWFPEQRPVTPRFDVLFDLRLNNRLSKHSRRWWFEAPSCSLWRHSNELPKFHAIAYIFVNLTHCGLMTAYGDTNLGQAWLR